MSVNKATLIGNLGKDQETSEAGQTTVCTFSLATTDRRKNESLTTWHNIVVFGKLAEICGKYLTKGKQVYIEGRIQNRSYDDKDGNKKYISEIVATEMQMLGSAKTDDKGPNRTQGGQTEAELGVGMGQQKEEPQMDDYEDIPF